MFVKPKKFCFFCFLFTLSRPKCLQTYIRQFAFNWITFHKKQSIVSTNVSAFVNPQRIFSGSPLCFKQLCVASFQPSWVYKPWVRGASALKASFWKPWTDDKCRASLLWSTEALDIVVPAIPKQSLDNGTGLLGFNGPEFPPSQGTWPYMTRRGTPLQVRCHGQSCLGCTMLRLALFRQQIAALEGRLSPIEDNRNSDEPREMTPGISVQRPLTKEADWDWPLPPAEQHTMMYPLHKLSLCDEK